MTYFSKGVAKTRRIRDDKVQFLAAIEAGDRTPSHGMSKAEAVIMLSQDIADCDEILARFRGYSDG